jgi:pimeloyl-ACP methyl ester carboxylesterase
VEHRIRLRDGRHIGVCEHGQRNGTPVLWFVGTGGSRRWQPPVVEAASSLGVRLLVVERPGFGISEFLPNRQLLDWPADFEQVLDGLGIARASIAGTSGAAPFLCAVAARLPERCSQVGLVACVGPIDVMLRYLSLRRRVILRVAAKAPRLIERVLRDQSPEQVYRAMTKDVAPCDRAVLDRPQVWRSQVEMFADSLQNGKRGFAWELHIAARPWGFALGDVRVPALVWHGTDDLAAPVGVARHIASAIPDCRVTLVEHEGHFLHYNHWFDILRALSQRDAAQSP